MSNERAYQKVSEKILELMESGTAPWNKPWQASHLANRSLSTRKMYSGSNQIFLSMVSSVFEYSSPYWATYKQIQERGGQVRKGEKSSPVIFSEPAFAIGKDQTPPGKMCRWYSSTAFIEKACIKNGFRYSSGINSHGQVCILVESPSSIVEYTKTIALDYFSVFNLDQADGIELTAEELKYTAQDVKPLEFSLIEAAERIVSGMPKRPEINDNGGDEAFYSPTTDTVSTPKKEFFKSIDGYYSTLFHELGHSTGHESRLARNFNGHRFGSHEYGKEELTAEFTAAFLCGMSGIEKTVDNSAAYLKSWSEKIKAEPEIITGAMSQAAKAANYILNTTAETVEA